MFKARLLFLSLTLVWTIVCRSDPASFSSTVLGPDSPSSITLTEQCPACPVISPRLPVAEITPQPDSAVNRTRNILKIVRATSFPELSNVEIGVRTFRSSSNYFRTRFSISRYLTFRKMRLYIEVNPRVFELGVPEEGVPAIIAHELEHVLYLSKRNRVELLSLARLASANYAARFERGADLRAIARGYGPGLILYRQWLYKNVDARTLKEKQKDYFSPDEIEAIQSIIQKQPHTLDYWLRHVPLSMEGIKKQGSVLTQLERI